MLQPVQFFTLTNDLMAAKTIHGDTIRIKRVEGNPSTILTPGAVACVDYDTTQFHLNASSSMEPKKNNPLTSMLGKKSRIILFGRARIILITKRAHIVRSKMQLVPCEVELNCTPHHDQATGAVKGWNLARISVHALSASPRRRKPQSFIARRENSFIRR